MSVFFSATPFFFFGAVVFSLYPLAFGDLQRVLGLPVGKP
jgi:hypothetical protein